MAYKFDVDTEAMRRLVDKSRRYEAYTKTPLFAKISKRKKRARVKPWKLPIY